MKMITYATLMIILLVCATVSVYAQERETTRVANTSSQTTSDWMKDPPSTVGWRSARWGMTVDEVINALPGQVKRKNAKESDEKIEIRASSQ